MENVAEQEFFGSTALRWYQVAATNETATKLGEGVKRILIHLPTGAGKTITIASALNNEKVRSALGVECDRPLRVLFVAHKNRLLTQAEQTFAADSGVELILQSAFSQIDDKVLEAGWDVTVIDECHHEAMVSIQYKLDQIGDIPIIGLTATPDRADGTLIKFEHFVSPISREQAVEEGYLCESEIYSFVDGVEKDKSSFIKSIIDQYHQSMGQMMVFVRTRKEVETITDHLTGLGYNAVALLSQNDKAVDKVLNDFSNKKIQFLVNCSKISEGIDVKNCTDVFLGRTVGSYPLLNQIIGRAARVDVPECRVWELVNPLNGRNLDTTVVVGTPKVHKLISKKRNGWSELEYDYVAQQDDGVTRQMTY